MSANPPQLELLASDPHGFERVRIAATPLKISSPEIAAETRREAHEQIKPHARDLRARVYQLICAAGAGGMTCDEIEVVTGLTHQTASARVNELMEGNHIRATGTKRYTRSHRKAAVWVKAGVGGDVENPQR